MPLEKIGKYERLDVLGHGASGIVYLAKDTKLGRQVALKVIEAPLSNPNEFLEEARTLDRLRHPNIVHLNGADEIDGKIVLDMEWMRGPTLKQRLEKQRQEPDSKLPVNEALTITAHILNDLRFAHEKRFLHRDIKPDNIFLTPDGLVKLGDFGNARPLVTNMYLVGGGTYPYMAPEAFAEQDSCDRRSDIWSVGVLLYEMLTGERPFHADAPDNPFAWKKLHEAAEKPKPLSESPSDLPDGLQLIVDIALAHDKRRRFHSVDNLLSMLKEYKLYKLPNTEAELREINRFVAAYNRIDKRLRQELGLDNRLATGFVEVVRQYNQQHPNWSNSSQLRKFAHQRLTHDLTESNQYRPVPSAAEIKKLEEIEYQLTGYQQLPKESAGKADVGKETPRGTDQPTMTVSPASQPHIPTTDSLYAEERPEVEQINSTPEINKGADYSKTVSNADASRTRVSVENVKAAFPDQEHKNNKQQTAAKIRTRKHSVYSRGCRYLFYWVLGLTPWYLSISLFIFDKPEIYRYFPHFVYSLDARESPRAAQNEFEVMLIILAILAVGILIISPYCSSSNGLKHGVAFVWFPLLIVPGYSLFPELGYRYSAALAILPSNVLTAPLKHLSGSLFLPIMIVPTCFLIVALLDKLPNSPTPGYDD